MSPSIRGSKSDTAAVTTASAVIGELHVPNLPVCLSAMIDNLPGRPRSPRVEESPAPRRNPAYPCRVGKRNKRTTQHSHCSGGHHAGTVQFNLFALARTGAAPSQGVGCPRERRLRGGSCRRHRGELGAARCLPSDGGL